jgi:glutamine amidotransferase
MGNLGSLSNMFKRIGVESEITSDHDKLLNAKKILLPGVGAFDAAMERINGGGFREILDKKALEEKIPVLGVCLGMQLLTNSSEEGKLPGLGWISAKTTKFSFAKDAKLKVPHMGWNRIYEKNASPLTSVLPPEPRFYFVHSYFVQADDSKHVLATTIHGVEFNSIIQKENIFGAQFHPEKSHKFGMKLLQNFAAL